MKTRMRLCEFCGYLYAVRCRLCRQHRALVQRWRALEELARALAWEDEWFAASHVKQRQEPVEYYLPHCYKCGWPDEYDFNIGDVDDGEPFPLSFRDGRWQCNRNGRNDGDGYCYLEPGLPAGTPTTIDTEAGPPQPADIEDVTDGKILELVMKMLIPEQRG